MIEVKMNGIKVEPESVFKAELVQVDVGHKPYRFEDENGNLTTKTKVEIGHWFEKPEDGNLKMAFSSSDGNFVIEWEKGAREPEVEMIKNGNQSQ